MNSVSTDYSVRTKPIGIVTPFTGGSMPIYEQPVIDIEGEGIKDVIKAGVKKGSRIVKSKIVRKAKGKLPLQQKRN